VTALVVPSCRAELRIWLSTPTGYTTVQDSSVSRETQNIRLFHVKHQTASLRATFNGNDIRLPLHGGDRAST